MNTIDEILQYAEIIGKKPGEMQPQELINKLKIAMRFAITKAQEYNTVESGLPKVSDFYLTKQSDNPKPHVYYFDGEYKGFFQGRGEQVFTVTHWRQIDLK